MTFDPFVLPFFLGLLFMLGILIARYARWIRDFSREDQILIAKGLVSLKVFPALKEIFMESLLHRKMFKRNALLGYMHMCFAFGWFMLILMGNFESRIYSKAHINPPYYPIFLKYFVHDKRLLPFEIFTVPGFFRFIMDFLLLLVLSGVVLAVIRRTYSNWFGLKKTTRHTGLDRIALTSLWLIFPLRLIAESFTAGYYLGGGFLTNTLGMAFASFLPVDVMAYPAWWAYSLSLGFFFVTLPYSRFMHIPTEVLLIFFRHFGVKPSTTYNSFSRAEVESCPRCGICLDACPINASKATNPTAPVYFLRSVREDEVNEHTAFDCLLCGRCQVFCPVGINTNHIRISQRKRFTQSVPFNFDYLKPSVQKKAEVVYFAGCMGQLTPSVIRAMTALLDEAGVNYNFLDKEGGLCCGRPLIMAGKERAANRLIDLNRKMIEETGAKVLVTSCPICFKVFKEDYNLGLEVLHHTQYLLRLVNASRLHIRSLDKTVAYHDPCELGRGSGIYEEPRILLKKFVRLVGSVHERTESQCCGGSLGDTELSALQRDRIRDEALANLMKYNPSSLVTACPLCKKTFSKGTEAEVTDIAELLASAIARQGDRHMHEKQRSRTQMTVGT